MYGLWNRCPDDVPVAWGARAVIDQWTDPKSGELRVSVSLMYDRQSWQGEHAERSAFSNRLNAGPIEAALERAKRELQEDGPLAYGESCESILHDQDGIRILANSNGSFGYVYLVAFPVMQ